MQTGLTLIITYSNSSCKPKIHQNAKIIHSIHSSVSHSVHQSIHQLISEFSFCLFNAIHSSIHPQTSTNLQAVLVANAVNVVVGGCIREVGEWQTFWRFWPILVTNSSNHHKSVCVCLSVCHLSVCMHTCLCGCACASAYLCKCMYICVCVCGCVCVATFCGSGGFLLTLRGFGDNVQPFIPRLHFFFFLKVEISSCTLIPVFMPGWIGSHTMPR